MNFVEKIINALIPARIYSRFKKSQAKKTGTKYYEEDDLKSWEKCINSPGIDPILKNMFLSYENSISEDMTSKYWHVLNKKNVIQLYEKGYENFKQTVALNYFTYLVDKNNLQCKFLESNLSSEDIQWAQRLAQKSTKHELFSSKQSRFYDYMTFMMWKYVGQKVDFDIVQKLEEPMIGNPPSVQLEGKNISQDLANSILEYDSILKGIGDFNGIKTIFELGAGYGRTSFVIQKLNPAARYVIVDVPPALYISQKYLSECFADRKVFMYREFNNFSEVETEFNAAQLIFLMPGQLEKIPDKSADLFLAIDCLHEMRPEQIKAYFKMIDRLSQKFYFTCNKKTSVPYEDIILEEKDYEPLAHWKKVFWKTRRVQDNYFEALFEC